MCFSIWCKQTLLGIIQSVCCLLFASDYKRTNLQRQSLSTKQSGLGSTTSVALLPVHEDNALVKKPLFWTSVVSVFISVVATIILIVLCTCKKSRPVLALHRIRRTPASQTRMPAQGENEKSESSTGTVRVLWLVSGNTEKQMKIILIVFAKTVLTCL